MTSLANEALTIEKGLPEDCEEACWKYSKCIENKLNVIVFL